MGPNQVKGVDEIKAMRVQADALIQEIRKDGDKEASTGFDHELYFFAEGQALRAATEAKMWAGKMLEGIGNPFPKELADKAEVQ